MPSPALVRDDGSDQEEIGRRETIGRVGELPQELGQTTVFSLPVHWGVKFFHGFLRAKIQSQGDGDHLQEVCAGSASSLGALRQFHLWIVLEQFQGRIEATTYEQASHCAHPESCVAPLDSRWKD
jgi:hypothetical protein